MRELSELPIEAQVEFFIAHIQWQCNANGDPSELGTRIRRTGGTAALPDSMRYYFNENKQSVFFGSVSIPVYSGRTPLLHQVLLKKHRNCVKMTRTLHPLTHKTPCTLWLLHMPDTVRYNSELVYKESHLLYSFW